MTEWVWIMIIPILAHPTDFILLLFYFNFPSILLMVSRYFYLEFSCSLCLFCLRSVLLSLFAKYLLSTIHKFNPTIIWIAIFIYGTIRSRLLFMNTSKTIHFYLCIFFFLLFVRFFCAYRVMVVFLKRFKQNVCVWCVCVSSYNFFHFHWIEVK